MRLLYGKPFPSDDAFSEFFELNASPVEGQSLQQKDIKKRRKRKLGPPKF